MPDIPTFDQFITSLEGAVGHPVDTERGLYEQGVDSLGIVEWLYTIEDYARLPLTDELLDLVVTAPIRDLYTVVAPFFDGLPQTALP